MLRIHMSDGIISHKMEENFEDTKWVIRCRKSKDRQHNGQNKHGTKGQATTYKTSI